MHRCGGLRQATAQLPDPAPPVGNYNPDWAISFKEEAVKHVYFVAETKGSMSSMNLTPIEQTKIECDR